MEWVSQAAGLIATMTCCRRAPLPPRQLPLRFLLSQRGELAWLWSRFKNKKKPLIPPQQDTSLIKKARG